MKIRLAIFLMPSLVSAALVVEGSLTDLFDRSDLVCSGRIRSQARLGPEKESERGKLLPGDWQAAVTVRHCYKGEAPGGELKLFRPSVDPMAGAPFALGASHLFFLKTQGDGSQVLTDPSSSLPFADPPSEANDAKTGIAQLEGDLARIATKGVAADSRNALELLL